MKIQKSNADLKQLVLNLYTFSTQNKSAFWRRIADDLLLPTRRKRLVNIFSLNINTKEGDVVIVPGKVLGTGDIDHKVTVAAFSFSQSAIDKIKQAKGNVMSIQELAQKNPKAKDVRIIA